MTRDPQLVVVQWVDSCGLEAGGWMDIEDLPANLAEDALRHETVGYLVGTSDVAIALAGSRNASNDDPDHRNTKLGNVIVIPRCSITHGPVALHAGRKLRRTTVTGRRREPSADSDDAKGGTTVSEAPPQGEPQPEPPDTGDDDDTSGDDDNGTESS